MNEQVLNSQKQSDQALPTSSAQSPADRGLISPPTISLPKGGGAIRGIGEKFSANPVTGTGSMSVPISASPGRAGFGPQLALSYDSGSGNGLFGLGWSLSLPAITRKTDKGLPRYLDHEESDVFILSGAEDLVPVLDGAGRRPKPTPCTVYGKRFLLRRYRPRIEGLFTLIERWTEKSEPANIFWRTISRDNITSWYGRTPESRIADPADASRTFQWFICETHDDKGNVASYGYLPEDGQEVDRSAPQESTRTDPQRTAMRYPKRIRYGNRVPFLPSMASGGTVWEQPDDTPGQWMFELVFDYGEHTGALPTPEPTSGAKLALRADPFSSHRPGFEVRTYRLCRRVLMFHHFEGEPGVGLNCLVRSTDFEYSEPDQPADAIQAGYTVLRAVSHHSYQRKAAPMQGYNSRQLPPVVFRYSEPQVDPTLRTIAPEQLENLPVGTQGPGYQWLDLDGEGLSGVLTEQAGAWYYKPNRGDGTFGPMRVVAHKPAMAALASGRQQFMDLSGNGEIDLVDFSGPAPGFHERDRDDGWKRHVPFASLPNIDWQDPNLRFVDLTGDGHADALITEQDVFTWYPSLEERGFAAAERTHHSRDEGAGPRLVFNDGTQTIFIADMCGDGLTDLVRIRNGEVCYWPNLGYGRFGRKVTLANSPRFDHSDLYDTRRIRLTDIDGSGPIDIIYLGRSGAQLYFNRSGNSLSNALLVDLPVATENLGAVQAADLLGNGTACLVWNSHLPADARYPTRYIDLMGGAEEPAKEHRKHEKPHLLIEVNNNLGGTTEIEYTPSTRFYLQDQQAGTPWITRLPFPVHCVSKVTVRDRWRGAAFSSTYSYHHGYFDGAEREFRGFGRVEQVDVESYGKSAEHNAASPYVTQDQTLYQPPVKTITWYHTGAALDRRRILTQFQTEYFPTSVAALPGYSALLSGFNEKPLPEPDLQSQDLNAAEWREALRACKGMTLRQEIYELDVDQLEAGKQIPVRLFSTATHNCHIRRLQPKGDNQHAVFLVIESEALSYHYELGLRSVTFPAGPDTIEPLEPDPCVTHTLNLSFDEYGNIEQSIAVGYKRAKLFADPELSDHFALIREVQGEPHLAYTETHYTGDVIEPVAATNTIQNYRLRVPWEVQTYELTGISPAKGRYFDLSELRGYHLSDTDQGSTVVGKCEYHEPPQGGAEKRKVEHVITLFFSDDLTTALDHGQLHRLGLTYETYKLALTKPLLQAVLGVKFDVTTESAINNPSVSGYWKGTNLLGNAGTDQWWMRSGRAGFTADAARHFYLPEEYTDPFGNKTTLSYDGNYDLFIQSSTDALGNTSGVAIVPPVTGKPRFDYRVLAPIEMVDANDNHSEVYFDILGMVVAMAAKGKVNEGDNLDGFTEAFANPDLATILNLFDLPPLTADDARAQFSPLLGDATTRFLYHFGETIENGKTVWASRPAGACAIARERHVGQLSAGEKSRLQVSLECSDGAGNVLMKKAQAEPDPDSTATIPPLRWIINGLTVLNNKGKPVKQYEPAFSDDFGCELPQANGVTPLMYYDAAGRLVRTELPDGTFSRVEFSPWHVKTFDANDTVLESQWYQKRGAPEPTLPLAANASSDTRAAWLAAQHANTPARTIFDSLGREVIAIAHNRVMNTNGQWQDEKYLTFTKLDAEGKPLWIRDARGNLVMQYITPAKANNDPTDAIPASAVPCYDIAGNLLFQHSMDAGDRWILMDAAGKPMLAWDTNQTPSAVPTSEDRIYLTEYDKLHRPTKQWLTINTDAPKMVERFEYVDTTGNPNIDAHKAANLVGQLVRHYDPSGRAENVRLDFNGNVLEVQRRLNNQPRESLIDWSTTNPDSLLETETFIQITEYDALKRMTRLYNWHRDITFAPDGTQQATHGKTNRVAVYLPEHNQRGALASEWLHVRASKATDANGRVSFTADAQRSQQAIQEIRYNAKGQKELLKLGNGTITRYDYDEKTFRLRQLRTTRPNYAQPFPKYRSDLKDKNVLQQLLYTYDPVGNLTEIIDEAYKPAFFQNALIEPRSQYEYDALYRLTKASGRENGAATGAPQQIESAAEIVSFPEAAANALRKYEQDYQYDSVGNIKKMHHSAGLGTWTRCCVPRSHRISSQSVILEIRSA